VVHIRPSLKPACRSATPPPNSPLIHSLWWHSSYFVAELVWNWPTVNSFKIFLIEFRHNYYHKKIYKLWKVITKIFFVLSMYIMLSWFWEQKYFLLLKINIIYKIFQNKNLFWNLELWNKFCSVLAIGQILPDF
jgi:hypothetical protein